MNDKRQRSRFFCLFILRSPLSIFHYKKYAKLKGNS